MIVKQKRKINYEVHSIYMVVEVIDENEIFYETVYISGS